MVDVFDRHEVRFDPRLAGCSKFVRHSDYATLEALLAERVKVKTLEWTRGWMNAEAQTEIGQYTITYRRDGSFEWGIGILKGWASSWDEAKAAAQADFERRILSALEATPPAPKVTDGTAGHDPKLGTTLHLMKQSWESRQPTNSGAPKVTEAMAIFDRHSLSSLVHKDQHDTVLAAIEEALTAAQEAGKP